MDVLIIGGDRGLGEGLFNHYNDQSNRVFTTSKTYPTGSNQSKKILFLDYEIIEDCASNVIQTLLEQDVSLDLVYFVAARTGAGDLMSEKEHSIFGNDLTWSLFSSYLRINTFGPIYLFEKIIQNNLLTDNSKTIFISSLAGSSELRGALPHMKSGGNLFYRVSKSALNCSVANIAFDLKSKGHIVISMHPGYVRTLSGGPDAQFSVSQAVENMVTTVKEIEISKTGKFLSYEHAVIPF